MQNFSYGTIYKKYIGLINNYGYKQVKFINSEDGSEEIIYDFNLKIGDTLKIGYGGLEYMKIANEELPLIIHSIDSIDYCGEKHKIYIGDFYFLTEGIGFDGFLEPTVISMLDYAKSTECYSENNNVKCDNCHLLNEIDEVIDIKNDVIINVAQGFVYFKSERNFQNIKIFNINGNEIYSEHNMNTNSYSIERSQLPASDHIFMCKFDINNQILVKKIVII